MKKNKILKKILSPLWVPMAKTYLQKERSANYFGIRLNIPTGVFHPSFFFSTKTIGMWMLNNNLENKPVLEIGCGSGAISLLAAKQGAKVTCCDINPEAVKTTRKNALKNQLEITCVVSDLFTDLEKSKFEYILNNPPYYAKDAVTMEEHAWNAGDNLEYFQRLFSSSKDFLTSNGKILLVLTDECNTELINNIAISEGFKYNVIYHRPNFIENTFIIQYKIEG